VTAQLVVNTSLPNGLQPMDMTRHLAGLADLIEICFAGEMDDGGRSVIREMRSLSHLGLGLHVLSWLGLGQEIWTSGYVWVESGRIVGSVSTQLSEAQPNTWLIANVATHPEYRRRGIAFALMQATLDMIRKRGGVEAILLVDDDNSGAIELYHRLGFTEITTSTNWVRPGRSMTPPLEPSRFDIRLRHWREWPDEMDLATLARPHGLTWNRPLSPKDFRPSVLRRLDRLLSGQTEEHWIAATASHQHPVGVLIIQTGLAEGDRLTLITHPALSGQLERPLLVRGLRRLGVRPWSTRIEHPTGDGVTNAALNDLGFQAARIRRWMRKEIR
jgi:GNAT superfamily N-acetyltransferase